MSIFPELLVQPNRPAIVLMEHLGIVAIPGDSVPNLPQDLNPDGADITSHNLHASLQTL